MFDRLWPSFKFCVCLIFRVNLALIAVVDANKKKRLHKNYFDLWKWMHRMHITGANARPKLRHLHIKNDTSNDKQFDLRSSINHCDTIVHKKNVQLLFRCHTATSLDARTQDIIWFFSICRFYISRMSLIVTTNFRCQFEAVANRFSACISSQMFHLVSKWL